MFIFSFQGKLMKLFSKQLSTIYKNQEILCLSDEDTSNYPQLSQFLYVVGVDGDVKEVFSAFESLRLLCVSMTKKMHY